MNKKSGLSKITAMVGEVQSMVRQWVVSVMSRLLHSTPHTSYRWESEVESLPMWLVWQKKLECTEIGEDKRISIKAKIKSIKHSPKTTTLASFMRKSVTTSKS